MIELRVEWQDVPGVRDPLLGRTWCRLTMDVDGQVVTRAIDHRSESLRDGIYGSVLPLCSWMVENWWCLQHEAYRFHRPWRSHDLAVTVDHRAWVQRHGLRAVGEGGVLPDLMLFRDGDVVVARWFADKADAAHPYLRFVGDGQASMPVDEVTHGLTDFVIRVLDRIEEMDAPEIEALRRDCARHGRALDRGRPRRCTGLAAANEPALAHGGRRWNAHETGYECARTLRRHLGANRRSGRRHARSHARSRLGAGAVADHGFEADQSTRCDTGSQRKRGAGRRREPGRRRRTGAVPACQVTLLSSLRRSARTPPHNGRPHLGPASIAGLRRRVSRSCKRLGQAYPGTRFVQRHRQIGGRIPGQPPGDRAPD